MIFEEELEELEGDRADGRLLRGTGHEFVLVRMAVQQSSKRKAAAAAAAAVATTTAAATRATQQQQEEENAAGSSSTGKGERKSRNNTGKGESTPNCKLNILSSLLFCITFCHILSGTSSFLCDKRDKAKNKLLLNTYLSSSSFWHLANQIQLPDRQTDGGQTGS